MANGKVVVVGAGIVGLAHALTALEAGWSVTLLERDGRALGASVRNFGTLWPIGCVAGPEREQALFGVKRWKELAREAGFWLGAHGSLSLAYREEAWEVLRQFAGSSVQEAGFKLIEPEVKAGRGSWPSWFKLLEPEEIAQSFPAANLDGLRGGLFSAAEAGIQPASAMEALAKLTAERGAVMHFATPVAKVMDSAVETSDGRRFEFDQLVIASGDDMRTLFPEELAAAQLRRCRLQMMRTRPQPAGFDLGAILVSDLTLCHYPAFRDCPSRPKLQARLEAELPEHHKWGVHVIAAQHPDGSLVVGDSHEYAADFAPESRTDVDELILGELRKFARAPNLEIAARWQGFYLKSAVGQTQVVLRPRKNVTMVTAMGGIGMTLSWGLAVKTVEGWG